MDIGFPGVIMFWDTSTGQPDPNFAMYGTASSYSGSTLEFAVTSVVGTGTKANWIIATANPGTDGQYGMRTVSRHNLFVNAIWTNHGAEAAGTRGGRLMEFYDNTMIANGNYNNPILLRSGTGMIYNNSITNYGTPVVSLLNYNSRDQVLRPWGSPDGRNPFHKNNSGNPFVTGSITSGNTTTLVYRDNTEKWTINQ